MANLAKFMRSEMEPWFSDPIDVLFRNFFENDSFFSPALFADVKYPVDIHETKKDLNIEIAVAGINKEDIQIEEENGILRVFYEKQQEEKDEDKHYLQHCIAKRSFNFGWKISEDKFDLKKINANMDKGILMISIPKIKEDKKSPKLKNTIEIK